MVEKALVCTCDPKMCAQMIPWPFAVMFFLDRVAFQGHGSLPENEHQCGGLLSGWPQWSFWWHPCLCRERGGCAWVFVHRLKKRHLERIGCPPKRWDVRLSWCFCYRWPYGWKCWTWGLNGLRLESFKKDMRASSESTLWIVHPWGAHCLGPKVTIRSFKSIAATHNISTYQEAQLHSTCKKEDWNPIGNLWDHVDLGVRTDPCLVVAYRHFF